MTYNSHSFTVYLLPFSTTVFVLEILSLSLSLLSPFLCFSPSPASLSLAFLKLDSARGSHEEVVSKNADSGSALGRPPDQSPSPTAFGQTTPREAPPSSSDHPPVLFQSPPLEPSQPPSASKTSQHNLFTLTPYLRTTTSSQIRQNYSARRKLLSTTWLTASAGLLHLPLSGLLF